MLEHDAAPHLDHDKLVRLLADWTPPFPGYFLYHPSRRQVRPILLAFLAAMWERGSSARGAHV